MKKLLLLCLVAMFTTLNAQSNPTPSPAQKVEKKAVKSTKVKATKKAAKATNVSYECPMKCTAPAKNPGKCSKCGMELEKKG